MSDVTQLDLGRRARRLRIETIVRLRWLAVGGQTAAVLVVHLGLGFQVPTTWCLVVIGLSGCLNIALRLRYSVNVRLDDGPASALMAYDVVQLSALLFLTGGLQNPFAMLFLAPVMISAASLPPHRTMALVFLTVCAATLLAVYHEPLPWFPDGVITMPIVYVLGIWFAVVLGAAFIGAYASLVSEEARRLSDALAATELILAREQHLSQLDGYAAAAAHELGTPLATITLVVRDLEKVVGLEHAIVDDVALLSQEVARCRAILKKLASLSNDTAGPLATMSLGLLLAEAVEPHRDFGVSLEVVKAGDGAEPVCPRSPGILYGLGNLVENAVDFAKTAVTIAAHWSHDTIVVVIEDDGPGFATDVMTRLGEPYLTTRGLERRAKNEADGGLGLGLFIAKTLLERSGAIMSMTNRSAPATGATIRLQWPRAVFERGRDLNRSAAYTPGPRHGVATVGVQSP